MPAPARCPSCGGEQTALSPDGLCPRCLLLNALASGGGLAAGPAPGEGHGDDAGVTGPGGADRMAPPASSGREDGPPPRVVLREEATEPPVARVPSPEAPDGGAFPGRYQLFNELARAGWEPCSGAETPTSAARSP
jgi:hypothetical protein